MESSTTYSFDQLRTSSRHCLHSHSVIQVTGLNNNVSNGTHSYGVTDSWKQLVEQHTIGDSETENGGFLNPSPLAEIVAPGSGRQIRIT